YAFALTAWAGVRRGGAGGGGRGGSTTRRSGAHTSSARTPRRLSATRTRPAGRPGGCGVGGHGRHGKQCDCEAHNLFHRTPPALSCRTGRPSTSFTDAARARAAEVAMTVPPSP